MLGNGNEPTDGSFGMIMDSAGVPVWYKRGAPGRIPRDLKRLADGSMAWFQTFGPGFGFDPTNGYENFELDGTPIDLIQTVGVVTNHHELVQMPNGNFLLTSMLTTVPPTLPPTEDSACRRQDAVGHVPGRQTSDFVLRAVVQEVDPAGNLVRDWNSDPEIALVRDHRPICFLVNGNDYLSSFHPNGVDFEANGAGTADDQILVSARHNDAVYLIDFDAETVDWKLGGTTTPESLTIVGDPLGGPKRQHDVQLLPERSHLDVRQSDPVHELRRLRSRPRAGRLATSSTPSTSWPVPPRWCARSAAPTGRSPARPAVAACSPMVVSSSTGVPFPARCSPSTTPPTSRSSRSTCRGSTRATGR